MKRFHTKLNRNRIINEDIQILVGGEWRKGPPFATFILIFNQHSNKDVSYKISSKSDNN